MSNKCSCFARQGDLKKRTVCYAPKCHHQAPLTADNIKAIEQNPNKKIRHPSSGMQSSLLIIRKHTLMRSFRHHIKLYKMKVLTLPVFQQKGDETKGRNCLMQCVPDWDPRHLAWRQDHV